MKDIIRFGISGKKWLVAENVTEEYAKEWCSREDTHSPGRWFDGFTPHKHFTGLPLIDKNRTYKIK